MASDDYMNTALSNDSSNGLASPETSLHYGKTTLLSAYETDVSYNIGNGNQEINLEVDILVNSKEKVTSFEIDIVADKIEYQLESKTYKSNIPFNILLGAKLTTLTFQPNSFQLSAYKKFLISPENSSSEFNLSFFVIKQKKIEAITFKLISNDNVLEFLDKFNALLLSKRNYSSNKLLVILNPNGGDRNSLYLFETITLPILTIANLKVEVLKSERERHIFDLIKSKSNLSEFSTIVSCGGDGTLHEVVNAALKHQEWQNVLNIPFAVLPAGSGNGTAKSLNLINFQDASLALVFHNVQPFDITVVHNDYNSEHSYMVLDITSGFIADVDETADTMRWLGKIRLEVASVIRALFLRHYAYTISYLKPDVNINSLNFQPTSTTDEEHTVLDIEPTSPVYGPKPNLPNLTSTFKSTNGKGLDPNWTTLDVVKSNMFVLNTPFISHNCKVSETAHPTNQSLSLVYEKQKLKSFGFLNKLIKESDNPGKGHYTGLLEEQYVMGIIIRCNGRAKGTDGDNKNLSTFRLDGEPMHKVTTVQLEILPRALKFVFPPNSE